MGDGVGGCKGRGPSTVADADTPGAGIAAIDDDNAAIPIPIAICKPKGFEAVAAVGWGGGRGNCSGRPADDDVDEDRTEVEGCSCGGRANGRSGRPSDS